MSMKVPRWPPCVGFHVHFLPSQKIISEGDEHWSKNRLFWKLQRKGKVKIKKCESNVIKRQCGLLLSWKEPLIQYNVGARKYERPYLKKGNLGDMCMWGPCFIDSNSTHTCFLCSMLVYVGFSSNYPSLWCQGKGMGLIDLPWLSFSGFCSCCIFFYQTLVLVSTSWVRIVLGLGERVTSSNSISWFCYVLRPFIIP